MENNLLNGGTEYGQAKAASDHGADVCPAVTTLVVQPASEGLRNTGPILMHLLQRDCPTCQGACRLLLGLVEQQMVGFNML